MRKSHPKPRSALLIACFVALTAPSFQAFASDYTVKLVSVEDKKAVFATVESTDSIAARVRITGTITELTVTEGSQVKAGETIALVRDPKLGLQIEAIEAQIRAAEREIANIKTEQERAEQLFKRGSTTKARLDQINTQYDVANSTLEASQAQKAVIQRQLEEGAVLAPQSGRVLDVPITIGSVVMPGEPVATIAKDNYILRLSLPERHARFLEKGDPVEVAGRGSDCEGSCTRTGEIVKVFPKIASGRVLADATVDGLGNYFVGERIQVRVGAGQRDTYLVPLGFVFNRYGVDFVHSNGTDGEATDIAVQIGRTYQRDGSTMIEILSGLQAGDVLLQP
ncbi:efflux RND transporter periplasmic adaptor subunit [Cohaesibacter celericrescens]|uniref:Efflux RND transporter periplasmic adaptor subunit n=1 Tax=Cohaesibacter celericrescens TaxID=2067669 RepID=A0A2N5XT71_9HYPH|nr:efflux RND transporter periplasmic adaptor subunit [Cohaesibacter celericrescens]PLW77657.1 efflux RND transporter periplasmic adaptor subunit [Cohaesibacter celericrescens]